jgi:hypothetical protein
LSTYDNDNNTGIVVGLFEHGIFRHTFEVIILQTRNLAKH